MVQEIRSFLLKITCHMLYEGVIGVIVSKVVGLPVDSCRLSKENFFRELTLISTFVFNIDLLCYGDCFSISLVESSELLSTHSKT